MKLHKLLYATQGVHLAQTHEPAFDDDVLQAWEGGPVSPLLFKTFVGRRYLSRGDLSRLGDAEALSPSVSAAVDSALELYGSFNGDALSDLSHAEPPWKEAWREGKNTPLAMDTLSDYFVGLLEAEAERDADASAEALLALFSEAS